MTFVDPHIRQLYYQARLARDELIKTNMTNHMVWCNDIV